MVKRDGRIALGALAAWDAAGPLAALPDGPYTFALRPHHVQPAAAAGAAAPPGAAAVEGQVNIAELSGSETTVHFGVEGQGWVSQSRGVHRFAVGERVAFRLDVARGLYFAADGRCVSAGGEG